jgi:hypothetical protein
MNRTGDQTCFLFSCRDRDSVSNFGQAYSEAIQDKEEILSILRINPGATRGGLSQRGHRLPAWVRRHLQAQLQGTTKQFRPTARPGPPPLLTIRLNPKANSHFLRRRRKSALIVRQVAGLARQPRLARFERTRAFRSSPGRFRTRGPHSETFEWFCGRLEVNLSCDKWSASLLSRLFFITSVLITTPG